MENQPFSKPPTLRHYHRIPTRSLAGNLYREHLEKLIRDSRRAIGWDAPWFVAQVSYHVPGDESSPDIRAAQASLWQTGIAIEGPDTDALKGEWRDSGGKGVHFSGPGLREHAARWVEKVAPWLESPAVGVESRFNHEPPLPNQLPPKENTRATPSP